MVRPGRLDKLLYVDLPSESERADILRAQTRRTPLGSDVDFEAIARHERAQYFSGADLSALVREAAVMALREVFSAVDMDSVDDENKNLDPAQGQGQGQASTTSGSTAGGGLQPVTVQMRHFVTALSRTPPSVSKQQRRRFELLRKNFSGQPVGHAKEQGGEAGDRPNPDLVEADNESGQSKSRSQREGNEVGDGAPVVV